MQMPTADTYAQSVLTFLLRVQKLNRYWDEVVLIWTELSGPLIPVNV